MIAFCKSDVNSAIYSALVLLPAVTVTVSITKLQFNAT